MNQAKLRGDFMDTEAAIRDIITARPNRYGDFLPTADVLVHWGEPAAGVYRLGGGFTWTIDVRADWLYAVHQAGISLVDGVLVVYAQEVRRRVECDAAWLARVVVPDVSPTTRLASGVGLRLTHLVRWQGQVHCGLDQQQALALCQQDYTEALVVGGDDDAT